MVIRLDPAAHGRVAGAAGCELAHDHRQEGVLKYRFIRADVAVRALGACDAALIEIVDRRRCTDGVVGRFTCGAA